MILVSNSHYWLASHNIKWPVSRGLVLVEVSLQILKGRCTMVGGVAGICTWEDLTWEPMKNCTNVWECELWVFQCCAAGLECRSDVLYLQEAWSQQEQNDMVSTGTQAPRIRMWCRKKFSDLTCVVQVSECFINAMSHQLHYQPATLLNARDPFTRLPIASINLGSYIIFI